MTTEHERMLEDRYILDFERSKQVRARRNALLANWLASHSRRNNAASVTADVLRLAQAAPSDDVLCDNLISDFGRTGDAFDRSVLRGRMTALTLEAAEQLAQEDASSSIQ